MRIGSRFTESMPRRALSIHHCGISIIQFTPDLKIESDIVSRVEFLIEQAYAAGTAPRTYMVFPLMTELMCAVMCSVV